MKSNKFEQIRKLIALSESDNKNESAVALAKAEKLMKEFGYREWEQFLRSNCNQDVSKLVICIAKYTEELPFTEDKDFQLGILEGIRTNVNSNQSSFDDYENSEKYFAGFLIADFICHDFFCGKNVNEIDYDFDFVKEI